MYTVLVSLPCLYIYMQNRPGIGLWAWSHALNAIVKPTDSSTFEGRPRYGSVSAIEFKSQNSLIYESHMEIFKVGCLNSGWWLYRPMEQTVGHCKREAYGVRVPACVCG